MNDEEPNGPKALLRPRYSGTVNLGHLIAILPVVLSVGGAYLAMQGRISEQSTTIAAVQTQLVELARRVQQNQDDQRMLTRDYADNILRLRDKLEEVRVGVAGIRDGVPHKQ